MLKLGGTHVCHDDLARSLIVEPCFTVLVLDMAAALPQVSVGPEPRMHAHAAMSSGLSDPLR
jgi:hypothetical protein